MSAEYKNTFNLASGQQTNSFNVGIEASLSILEGKEREGHGGEM